MQEKIAAVDPGRDKCGVAVLSSDGEICYREVVPTGDLIKRLNEKKSEYGFSKLIIGDGTTSKKTHSRIAEELQGVEVVEVDEYNTTQLAKKVYWELEPPKGWRKLLPLSIQTPPVPVDDVVAVILGRRYLNERK